MSAPNTTTTTSGLPRPPAPTAEAQHETERIEAEREAAAEPAGEAKGVLIEPTQAKSVDVRVKADRENRAFVAATAHLLEAQEIDEAGLESAVAALERDGGAPAARSLYAVRRQLRAARGGEDGWLRGVEVRGDAVLRDFEKREAEKAKARDIIRSDPRRSDLAKRDDLQKLDADDDPSLDAAFRGFDGPDGPLTIVKEGRAKLRETLKRYAPAKQTPSDTDRLVRELRELRLEQWVTNTATMSGASRNHERAVEVLDRLAAEADESEDPEALARVRVWLRRLAVAAPDSAKAKSAALSIRERAVALRQRELLGNPALLALAVELHMLNQVETGVRGVIAHLRRHRGGEVALARQRLRDHFERLGG